VPLVSCPFPSGFTRDKPPSTLCDTPFIYLFFSLVNLDFSIVFKRFATGRVAREQKQALVKVEAGAGW
jgi:hypothetical protein